MTTAPPPPGSGETRPQRAVWSLRTAIEVAAREGFGAAMVERPVAGFALPYRDVEPIAGVRAAVLARDVAAGRVREYALAARSDGRSWEDIAEALGVAGGCGQWSRAELAYRHLIEGRSLYPDAGHPWPPAASWRCGSCGQRVTDRGPFEAAPYNNEEGHAPGCTRHAAEVAAYRAERDAGRAGDVL